LIEIREELCAASEDAGLNADGKQNSMRLREYSAQNSLFLLSAQAINTSNTLFFWAKKDILSPAFPVHDLIPGTREFHA